MNPMSRRGFLARAGALGLAAGAGMAGLSACGSDIGGVSLAGQPTSSSLYPFAQARAYNDTLRWPTPVNEPKSKVSIVVAHTWTPDFWPRQMQFDQFFMERHPNIELLTENTPGGDYQEKYVIQGTSGALPDVMYAQWSFAQMFIAADKFLNLDPLIARQPGFDIGDFTRPALGFYSRGSSVYGLCYDCGPIMLVYNKDLFDARKVDYPDSSWTVDDLQRAAARLVSGTGGNKVYGFGTFPSVALPYCGPLFLQPFGARFLDPSQQHAEIGSAAAATAMNWWVDKVGPSAPDFAEYTELVTQTGGTGPFVIGHAAMDLGGAWLSTYLSEAKFRYGFADWPAGPAGRFTGAVGSCYAITSDCRQRDAAWIYLNEYTSTAGLSFMFGSTGISTPGRKSAWPSYLGSKLTPDGASHFYQALTTYATTDGIIYQPAGPKITDATTPVWDQVYEGELDVTTGLDEINSRVKPILLGSIA